MKKTEQLKELRKASVQELEQQLQTLNKEMFIARSEGAHGQKKLAQLKANKEKKARIYTILREKELA